MPGNKHGFTLIELMLAMIIMGIVASLVIPTIQQLRPQSTQQEFARKFNELCMLAWQHAITTQTTQRIFFDLKKRIMRIEAEQQPAESLKKEPQFKPLEIQFAQTEYRWPEQIVFKQFYINGEEKLQKIGSKTTTIWFYIVPDGLTQDVIINCVDSDMLDAQGSPIKMGVTVNPFTAQVRRYDTFQKP